MPQLHRFKKGVIAVSSNPDVGKTKFVLSAGMKPEQCVVIDGDGKTINDLEQIGVDKFAGVIEVLPRVFDKLEIPYTKEVFKILEEAYQIGKKNAKAKYLIIDSYPTLTVHMRYYIEKNMDQYFRDRRMQSGGVGGARVTRAHDVSIEAGWIMKLFEVYDTIFLTAHLKPLWKQKKDTGKQKPAFSEGVHRFTSLKLWLRRNPEGEVPIAICQKRFTLWEGMQPLSVIPVRLQPQAGDNTLWDVIDRYVEEPIGKRDPFYLEDYEMLTPQEMADIQGVLTSDEVDALRVLSRLNDAEEIDNSTSAPDQLNETDQQVVSMVAEGKPNKEIADALGISVKEVIAIKAKLT